MSAGGEFLPLTHIVLPLPQDQWSRLLLFITDPDGVHQSGGYQGRKGKWRLRINEALHSIELDPDDVGWIRRQIENRQGGGWESKVARIFKGQHELFTGIKEKPRRPNPNGGTEPGNPIRPP